MASLEQLADWLLVETETQTLEFKEARENFDFEKLCTYCVALANESGGHLVLGVTDRLPRKIVGSSAFPDLMEITDRLFRKLSFRVYVDELPHRDGRVLVFTVPSRPLGTAYQLDGRYLMRSGSTIAPMTEDRLRTIFAENGPNWLEAPCVRNVTAQDVIDLLDTQTFFELAGTSHPVTRDGVIDRLVRERLVSNAHDGFTLSRLCVLLLAKQLHQFPDVARKAPRVIVYTGSSKLDVRIDWLGQRGYAVGFQDVVRFVMEQLPQNETVRNALRQEMRLLPERSIRELIANALIHQDFTIQGAGPMVEIYANRVEISNPGTPIVEVDRFIDGYQSRNEQLADLMRRMRICEERSSGVDRVITDAEVFQLPAPEFRADHNRTNVLIHGPKGFGQMDRDDRIRACYQHCALRWVNSEQMTNQSLRQRFGLLSNQSATVSQIISATISAELIKQDDAVGGSRKFARYLPYWA